MSWRKGLKSIIVSSLLLVIALLIVLPPPEAGAQEPLIRYPKYRIYGLIELIYQDYNTSVTVGGKKSKSDTDFFEQRYKLGVAGYILHPRVAIYSTDVTFRYKTIDYDRNGVDTSRRERDLDYNLALSLLPSRPVSLDLYAARNNGTRSDETGSFDATSNTYGATLTVRLKDLLSKKRSGSNSNKGNGGKATLEALPVVTLRYNHWDYTVDDSFGTTITDSDTDEFGVDVNGALKAIRTTYRLGYDFIRYSTPAFSRDSYSITGSTITTLSQGKTVLTTTFQYLDADVSKYGNFNAELQLRPSERFMHNYYYSFYTFDTPANSTSHYVAGEWDYRFTNRLSGHGNAYYTITTSDTESEDQYGTSATVYYNRPIKDLDFSSTYRLGYQHLISAGETVGNAVRLALRTRKLKWGTIYTEDDFTYLTTSNRGDFIQNLTKVGVRGRGPGRANWNLEAQYNYTRDETGSSGDFADPQLVGFLGARSMSYYSLLAEVGYPIGRRGLIALRGSYLWGDADSHSFRTYYYETRLVYRFLRNLYLIAWWKEQRDDYHVFGLNRKTRDYEARLYYRLKRVFLSLEYRVWKADYDFSNTETKTLYMKLSRPI